MSSRSHSPAGAALCPCRLVAVIVVFNASLAGCNSTSTAAETSSDLTSAVVYGSVADAAGAPLVGALVKASVHADTTDCKVGTNGLSGGAPVASDGLGRYRAVVSVPLLPQRLCVSLRVMPGGSASSAEFVRGGERSVMLKAPADGIALDSVMYNVRAPVP